MMGYKVTSKSPLTVMFLNFQTVIGFTLSKKDSSKRVPGIAIVIQMLFCYNVNNSNRLMEGMTQRCVDNYRIPTTP